MHACTRADTHALPVRTCERELAAGACPARPHTDALNVLELAPH
jgi:hypothetical protein